MMPSYSYFIVFIIGIFQIGNANETSRAQYLELVKNHPGIVQPQGKASNGEIEIILDNQRMAAIEKKMGREVGIVAQDRYWVWVNDACLFPSGHEGVYGRALHAKALESVPGVAVMPILPDGKVVLNCNFRHATRSWEIELPRGGLNVGETPEDGARRETMEETGMVIDSLTLLGDIPPDTGMSSAIVPIYVAKVIKKQQAEQEESEAIEEILTFSFSEIKEAFVNGYIMRKIRGKEKQVYFRDPFLAYAVLLYELKKKKQDKQN